MTETDEGVKRVNVDNVKWVLLNADLVPPKLAQGNKVNPRWHLRLVMALDPGMSMGGVARLTGAIRQFVRELGERSGLVYLTEAPARGAYDGLEGASVDECRRQVRNLRSSTMALTQKLKVLEAEVPAETAPPTPNPSDRATSLVRQLAQPCLRSLDLEVRESAIHALEAVGGAESRAILHQHDEPDRVLRDYLTRVVRDLAAGE